MLCITIIFPLFLCEDTLRNKICIFLIIYGFLIISEISGSIVLMIVVSVLNIKIIFPQELVFSHSILAFILVSIMIIIDYIIVFNIRWIFRFINILKLSKNLFMFLINGIILNIDITLLNYADTNNFIVISILFLIILMINIILISTNISDFAFKYRKYSNLRYYNSIIYKQKKSLKAIDNTFREIRKRNHNFNNHMSIINYLMQYDIKKAKQYIEMLITNRGRS